MIIWESPQKLEGMPLILSFIFFLISKKVPILVSCSNTIIEKKHHKNQNFFFFFLKKDYLAGHTKGLELDKHLYNKN